MRTRGREEDMSKLCVLLVGTLLCLGVATASAQTAPDATVADPDHHQVVLDNEHVRVLTAVAGPGARSPMHSHPPILIVSLGTARVRMALPDGKKQILDLRPGTVFWVDGIEHSWELLGGEVNVVAVEVKAAKAAKMAKPK
jgi:quercetin dioxygenase-like cupin family protein